MENKELSRYPRVLSEVYNMGLVDRLYDIGGNSVAFDLIIYLANNQMKNLFGETWFSINEFCDAMGYERTKLHRKLTKDQMSKLFESRKPQYISLVDGKEVIHPIETVFEAALYKLGVENLTFPVRNNTGSTSYNFVQIITKFDIMTDFSTKKGTKRLYSATLSNIIKDSLFNEYNLMEMKDYRVLPDRFRYFYINLVRMVYLIKYKVMQGQAPYFTLTVDQLAKMFDVDVAENNNRKTKVTSVLNKINNYLKVTKFQFEYIKGENQKWAYTVRFYFPADTLQYFDEKYNAVFTSKFYLSLLWNYVNIFYPETLGVARGRKVEEIKADNQQYQSFLTWAHSDENLAAKEAAYRNTFIEVFKRTPEELGLELFNLVF